MADPPELWLFVASNLVLFAFGSAISGLSYAAYRRDTGNRTLRDAAVGFALITTGALIEIVWELGVRGTYELGGRELLALHTVETFLIAAGLAVIFASIWRR